jgi:cell division protein FtsQ
MMSEVKKTPTSSTRPVSHRVSSTGRTQPSGAKRVSSSKPKSKQSKSLLDWLYVPVNSSSKSSKKTNRYEAPAVMTRGTPMVRKPKQGVRRQQSTVYPRRDYNLPNNPGSITLPSLPHLQMSWRVLSFFLAAAIGVGLYFAWTSTLFQVQDIEITGLRRVTEQDIKTILDVNNRPSFTLDPQDMQENLLLQFPELITATIQVGFPNTVALTVTERLPVLVWEQDGRTNLVDADGMAFPLRGEEVDAALPRVIALGELSTLSVRPVQMETFSVDIAREGVIAPVTSLQARKILDPEVVTAVLVLRDHSPEGVPLIYSDEHGFGWEDAGGWQVYFGDASDIQMKLRVYRSILQMLDDKDVLPSLVSVEWVHAPYYRLEQ